MRVRRSLLNFATHALGMAVTMIVALPATRYLQLWLGASLYGGVRIVTSAFGYLTLLELGLSGAIGPLLARALGNGDESGVHETVAAGTRAYLVVAAASIAVGLALTPVVPRFAEGLTPAEVVDLKRAWWLLLAAFVPLALLPLRSVLDALQLGYVLNLMVIAQLLLITGVSLFLAWAGWGITGQAAAVVIGNWAFSMALAAYVFRSRPGLLRSVLTMPTTPETRRALRNLSTPTLLLNVCGRVSVLSDELVIGFFLNTRHVTALVNTQKLASMGQSVLLAVGGASWAAMAQLHSQGQVETFNRRLVEMTRMVSVLAVVGLVPVVAYNRAFIRLWLPGADYGGDAVTILAAVNAWLLSTQVLWGWCFTATGKIRYVVPQAVAGAVLNVETSVLMTERVGLPGPLIGSTVAIVVVQLWAMPWLLYRVFGTPPGAMAKALGVPFTVGVVAAFGLRRLTEFHEPNGWAALAAEMSLSALVMLVLSATLLLTREDRALWRLRLSTLRPSPASPAVVAEESGTLP